MPPTMRMVRKSTVIAGASPLALVASWYVFVAIVRVSMGTLPDPDTLPLPLNVGSILAQYSLLMLYQLALLAIFGLALSVFRPFRCVCGGSAAFLLGTTFAFWFIGIADPGGAFAWLMD